MVTRLAGTWRGCHESSAGAAKVTRRSNFTYGEKLDQLVDIGGAAKDTRRSNITYGEKLDQLMDIEGAAKVTSLSSFTHQEQLGQIRDWKGTIEPVHFPILGIKRATPRCDWGVASVVVRRKSTRPPSGTDQIPQAEIAQAHQRSFDDNPPSVPATLYAKLPACPFPASIQ